MSITRSLALATATALACLALTSCTDSDAGPGETDEEPTAADVLATAKDRLDETSGVRIRLSTDDLPQGVQGVVGAEGVGTSAPAFDGSIRVLFAGTNVEVPIIAVDGSVFAQIPLVPGWSDVDPADYGAPDPAQLMAPGVGFSTVLTATQDPEEGDSVRGGEGNREVLTEYTGTVPGEAAATVIPSASGDFDATYTITEDGELREAALTGVFYPDSPAMTYTIAFSDYGVEQEITAP